MFLIKRFFQDRPWWSSTDFKIKPLISSSPNMHPRSQRYDKKYMLNRFFTDSARGSELFELEKRCTTMPFYTNSRKKPEEKQSNILKNSTTQVSHSTDTTHSSGNKHGRQRKKSKAVPHVKTNSSRKTTTYTSSSDEAKAQSRARRRSAPKTPESSSSELEGLATKLNELEDQVLPSNKNTNDLETPSIPEHTKERQGAAETKFMEPVNQSTSRSEEIIKLLDRTYSPPHNSCTLKHDKSTSKSTSATLTIDKSTQSECNRVDEVSQVGIGSHERGRRKLNTEPTERRSSRSGTSAGNLIVEVSKIKLSKSHKRSLTPERSKSKTSRSGRHVSTTRSDLSRSMDKSAKSQLSGTIKSLVESSAAQSGRHVPTVTRSSDLSRSMDKSTKSQLSGTIKSLVESSAALSGRHVSTVTRSSDLSRSMDKSTKSHLSGTIKSLIVSDKTYESSKSKISNYTSSSNYSNNSKNDNISNVSSGHVQEVSDKISDHLDVRPSDGLNYQSRQRINGDDRIHWEIYSLGQDSIEVSTENENKASGSESFYMDFSVPASGTSLFKKSQSETCQNNNFMKIFMEYECFKSTSCPVFRDFSELSKPSLNYTDSLMRTLSPVSARTTCPTSSGTRAIVSTISTDTSEFVSNRASQKSSTNNPTHLSKSDSLAGNATTNDDSSDFVSKYSQSAASDLLQDDQNFDSQTKTEDFSSGTISKNLSHTSDIFSERSLQSSFSGSIEVHQNPSDNFNQRTSSGLPRGSVRRVFAPDSGTSQTTEVTNRASSETSFLSSADESEPKDEQVGMTISFRELRHHSSEVIPRFRSQPNLISRLNKDRRLRIKKSKSSHAIARPK